MIEQRNIALRGPPNHYVCINQLFDLHTSVAKLSVKNSAIGQSQPYNIAYYVFAAFCLATTNADRTPCIEKENDVQLKAIISKYDNDGAWKYPSKSFLTPPLFANTPANRLISYTLRPLI